MNHFIFWLLGFGTLWAGLKLFDDEVILIVSVVIGSTFVFAGLLTAPFPLQVGIEVILLMAVFHLCMECIERGNRAQ